MLVTLIPGLALCRPGTPASNQLLLTWQLPRDGYRDAW